MFVTKYYSLFFRSGPISFLLRRGRDFYYIFPTALAGGKIYEKNLVRGAIEMISGLNVNNKLYILSSIIINNVIWHHEMKTSAPKAIRDSVWIISVQHVSRASRIGGVSVSWGQQHCLFMFQHYRLPVQWHTRTALTAVTAWVVPSAWGMGLSRALKI